MNVQHVDPAYIHLVWDQVAPFFEAAIDSSGVQEYTIDQIKLRITDDVWKVLVAVNEDNQIVGAAAITFFNRANDRVGYVMYAGGRLITADDAFTQMKQYMVGNGATCIEASARESVAKLLSRRGMQEKYRVVGMKL